MSAERGAHLERPNALTSEAPAVRKEHSINTHAAAKTADHKAQAGTRDPNEDLVGVPGSRHEIATPALVLDLEAMEHNITSLAAHAKAHGYSVRPVAKIHKSVEIARRQVEAGGIGVCCATLSEAEAMVEGGIPGVLLFTPVVTAAKLDRLAALNARVNDLLVVADDPRIVRLFANAARESGRAMRVLVDLEVGGRRTGIREDGAVALAQLLVQTDGLEYAGVHAYVGNHQNTVSYQARRERSRALLEPLGRVITDLTAEGLAPAIVSGGGTGTHDFDSVFTEIQAGSYVFMDVNYRGVTLRQDDPNPFRPALFVRTTVISAAQDDFVITDAGVKELDAIFGIDHPIIAQGAPSDAVYSLVGDDMGRIEVAEASEKLPLGSVVEVIPPHCYQTLFMYSKYHVVRGDALIDIWPVDARASW
jgi:3-hydroxy-D-aspartate aldolase